MKRLSKEQILMLHSQLIEQTGGIDGVRDFNLLESAIETPFQAFGGEELYPTIFVYELYRMLRGAVFSGKRLAQEAVMVWKEDR